MRRLRRPGRTSNLAAPPPAGAAAPPLIFVAREATSAAMSATILNLQGLKCPLPALKTRKALKAAKRGAQLVVECTDPLAAIDIPHLVRETGDVLEASERKDDVLSFRIRKA